MVEIRPARPGEGQALYDVTAAAIAARAPGFYSPAQVAAWMDGRDAAHYEQVIAEGAVRVAVRDGEVVGFVDSAPGVLLRLFVRPDIAGQGLGRRLLELGVQAAMLDGQVRLEATLHATAFYTRFGFVETGRVVFQHPLGGLPVEVVSMVLRVPGLMSGPAV